jgi:hypothetical protein
VPELFGYGSSSGLASSDSALAQTTTTTLDSNVRLVIPIDPQLEAEARGDIPPEHAHVIGVSIAPSGRYAVVMLTVGEGPAMGFDETVAEHVGDRWLGLSSGTPSSVIYAGDHRAAPLCNYMDPLPPEVERVVISDRGEKHEVPVERGYFLYAAWKQDTPGDNATDPPTPEVVGTIPAIALE